MTEGIGLGIVGAGGFATFLAGAASLSGVAVRAVADLRPGAARRLAEAHEARVVESWTALLSDASVDAVVVATTPDSHALIARAAVHGRAESLSATPVPVR